MGKIKKLELTPKQYAELDNGFRNGGSHCFRMRCRAVLLKGKGLSSVKAGEQTEMSFVSVNAWVKRFLSEGIDGLETRPGRGRKPIMDCSDEQAVRLAIEQDRQSGEQSQRSMAAGDRETSKRYNVQAFFIRIGARYKRIRKRPRGKPSPQLYQYKYEKLQELEAQQREGRIDLYYADESHICTEGYVPYGWQFPGEDVYIASGHSARMNIFGMINRKNNYKGFATTDSITADKVVEFLDALSFQVRKNTFVVLDNATVHRNHKVKEL